MIRNYVKTCEKIANDPKLPARICDWADDIYRRFYHAESWAQPNIRVGELNLLELFEEDAEFALSLIDAALARGDFTVQSSASS